MVYEALKDVIENTNFKLEDTLEKNLCNVF